MIYKEINVPRLENFYEKLNINFHNSILNSNNSALNTLPAYDPVYTVDRKRPKVAINVTNLI